MHRPQTGAMHRPQAETVRGQQDMATSPAPAGKRPGPEGTNPSPYAFGTIPENTSLRVRGHAKGNHAVRWVKKSRSYVEMASMYGLMRITPVAPDIIRVSFVKGVTEKIAATGWMAKAEEAFSWSARESKSVVEIAAGEITVREQGESASACGKCRGAESDRRGGKLGIFRLGQERAHQGKGHARYGFSGCDIKCALYILRREKA